MNRLFDPRELYPEIVKSAIPSVAKLPLRSDLEQLLERSNPPTDIGEVKRAYAFQPASEESYPQLTFLIALLYSVSVHTSPSQALIGRAAQTEIMKKLDDLKSELMNEITQLRKALPLADTAQARVIRQIIYFDSFEECQRALRYLASRRFYNEVRGSGVVFTTANAASILRTEGFAFNTASSVKEIHEKEPQRRQDYANQVRKHYGLSQWTNPSDD